MKKFTVALATAAVALTMGVAEAKEWTKVRIGTEGAYLPYNGMSPSGELIGFEIDLGRELCRIMNVECEFVQQDWDGMIPALQIGKFDAIMAGMSVKPERLEKIDFSIQYATEPTAFGAVKDSELAKLTFPLDKMNLDEISPEEQAVIDQLAKALDGKAVGVQVSTIQQQLLEQYIPGADIRTYDTFDSMALDLAAGRIDAGLAGRVNFEDFNKSDAAKDKQLAVFGPDMQGGVLGTGVGVGIRKEDTDLKEMFNKALAEAYKQGITQKLAVQWFGFDAALPPPAGY